MLRKNLSQRGFTLVELVLIVGLLGIVVSLSAGDFTQWVRRTRFKTMTRSIYNGLVLARAEAIRRGTVVSCNLGPERFEVFLDTNGNGAFDDTEQFIFSYPTVNDWFALRQGHEITTFRDGTSIDSPSGAFVLFNSRGYSVDRAQELREMDFDVVDDELSFAGRKTVDVSAAGSVRIRD